jgi:hypothetical protein
MPPDALSNGCYPLPDGVRLDLPYQVRSDVDVRTGGRERRELVGHYSLVDEQHALAALVGSFRSRGFTESPAPGTADEVLPGAATRVLTKPGTGRVVVQVQPLPDTSPDTLVRGVFALDLPVAERASDSAWCDRPSSTKRWPQPLDPGVAP